MIRFIEWLWGHKLGPAPFIKGWHLGIDTHGPRRQWGLTFVSYGDRKEGGTHTPIWNWVWLCNRLGWRHD